ncbi:MAG: BREX-1 system adenine-specific DNA-methyltransferase PglX, partial [Desulfovibrio piger]|nr:BREX-1 system adenine-specific DNA-methyltransferase PglX [Desulfovibrio piger]
MNRTAAKNYAPAARQDFIQAVTARAHALGITEKDSLPAQISGDVAIIGGQAFPRAFALQRQKLVEDVARRGFAQVMEEAAYTWFNRFVALRFMELRGWLACGCMVLGSESSTGLPAILDHLADLDETVFPAEVLAHARELRLAGDREEELYHLLLIAQCNALHACLPLLFEKVSDTSELLLPDNLLYSDSVIRRLVREIPDEDWESVEIIGWLYQ